MKKEENKQAVSPFVFIAFGLIIVGLVTFSVVRGKQKTEAPPANPPVSSNTQDPIIPEPQIPAASTPDEPEEFRMPPFHTNVSAVSLPPIKDLATVPPEARSAYLAAQKKPQLIAQLPCFCYCDRWGHTSLHDCFTTEHAITCDICMKTALQADQLDKKGMPVDEIRETIVAQFSPRAEDHAGHDH